MQLCVVLALWGSALEMTVSARVKVSKQSRNAAPTDSPDSPLLSLNPIDDLAKPFVLLEGPGKNPSKAILVGSFHYIDANSLDWVLALAHYLSPGPAGHFSPGHPELMFFEVSDVQNFRESTANSTLSRQKRAEYMALDRAIDSTVFRFLQETYGPSIIPVELDAERRARSEEDPSCECEASSFDISGDATMVNLLDIAKAAYRSRMKFGWLLAMRHFRDIMRKDYQEMWKHQVELREPGWRTVMAEKGAFEKNSVIVVGIGHVAEILQWFVERGFTMEDPILKLWRDLVTQEGSEARELFQQQGELFEQQRNLAQHAIEQVMEERPKVKEDQEQRRQLQEHDRMLQERRRALRERRRRQDQEHRQATRSIELAGRAEAPVVKKSDCSCNFWRRLME